MRPWTGPYLITQRICGVTYRIQASPRGKTQVVHADRLKKCYGTKAQDLGFGGEPTETTPPPPAPMEELDDTLAGEVPMPGSRVEPDSETDPGLTPKGEVLPPGQPLRTRRGKVSRPPQRFGIDD